MQAMVSAIQQAYPQVFHACHVRHTRRRSNAFRLSERDAAILAHVGPAYAFTARDLGAHLGIGAPTMSAAIKRLEQLGYLTRSARSRDTAVRILQLTALGGQALQATSVLDTERLTALLATLSVRHRTRAVQGLELLARGARNLTKQEVSS